MAISLAHLEDPENATAAYDQVSWFYPVTLNTPDDCNIRFELFILIFFPPNLQAVNLDSRDPAVPLNYAVFLNKLGKVSIKKTLGRVRCLMTNAIKNDSIQK